MKFCSDHHAALVELIEREGLSHLAATDSDLATAQAVDHFNRGATPVNFDPVIHATNLIYANGLRAISDGGPTGPQVVLYLLDETRPEDPIEPECYRNHEAFLARVRPAGQCDLLWPRCPLCYLNIVHELCCDGSADCSLDLIRGYDWMLETAAKDTFRKAVELELVAKPAGWEIHEAW